MSYVHWTAEQSSRVQELRAGGMEYKWIARAIGCVRTPQAIKRHLQRIAA